MGFFTKDRVLDKEVALERSADVVTDMFGADNSLGMMDYIAIDTFGDIARKNADEVTDKFYSEKLLFLSCAAVLVLKGSFGVDASPKELLKYLKRFIAEKDLEQVNLNLASFSKNLEEWIKIRTEAMEDPSAGILENYFSRRVFGIVPDKSDTDANYLLYKSLSGIETRAIRRFGASLRKS